MIHLSAKFATAIASVWALAIAYVSQLPHLPSWAPYLVAGGGVLLAALGINVPQVPAILQAHPPASSSVPTPPQGAVE